MLQKHINDSAVLHASLILTFFHLRLRRRKVNTYQLLNAEFTDMHFVYGLAYYGLADASGKIYKLTSTPSSNVLTSCTKIDPLSKNARYLAATIVFSPMKSFFQKQWTGIRKQDFVQLSLPQKYLQRQSGKGMHECEASFAIHSCTCFLRQMHECGAQLCLTFIFSASKNYSQMALLDVGHFYDGI